MNNYNLMVTMGFRSDPHGTDDIFEAFLDQVVVELENIGREVGIATSLANRTADFDAVITASSFENAASALMSDIRTALHAADCHTPDWPRFVAESRQITELTSA